MQLSTAIPFNVIKNPSSLKITAIINEVEGCRDLSPVVESAARCGKANSREKEGECPDHEQKYN